MKFCEENIDIWNNAVVRTICIYLFLAFSTKAIYDGNVYTGYLYNLVDHHNSQVGLASGVTGLTMVTLAPFLGIISDKYGRIVLLKVGLVCGYVAVALFLHAITVDNFNSILVAQVVFGSFWACTTPTMDALIADWTDPGTRSKIYTLRLTIVQGASTCGPLLNIFLFLYLGNNWDMPICRTVMYVGLCLFLVPVTLLHFSFPMSFDQSPCNQTPTEKSNDKYGTPKLAEEDQLSTQSSHGLLQDFDSKVEEGEEGIGAGSGGGAEMANPATAMDTAAMKSEVDEENAKYEQEMVVMNPINQMKGEGEGEDKKREQTQQTRDEETVGDIMYCTVPYLPSNYNCNSILHIPAMVSMYEIITSLASGMSVKFFPIFFLHVLELDPIQVQFIYLLTPILTATTANLVQSYSRIWGRIFVTCVVRACGTSLLLLMAWITSQHAFFVTSSSNDGGNDGDVDQKESNADMGVWRYVLICVFLLRSALMNSTKPLTKSIMMDFVPKKQRGRWQALQSVNEFSWSGSAFLGGLLIDRYGFTGIFTATACSQAMAIVPLISVAKHIPMEK